MYKVVQIIICKVIKIMAKFPVYINMNMHSKYEIKIDKHNSILM